MFEKLDDSAVKHTNANDREYVPYSDGVDPESIKLPEYNDLVMPDGNAAFEIPITYQLNHAELNLPQGDLLRKTKVIGRTKDGNCDVAGSHYPYPFLNTLNDDIEFSDGKSKNVLPM